MSVFPSDSSKKTLGWKCKITELDFYYLLTNNYIAIHKDSRTENGKRIAKGSSKASNASSGKALEPCKARLWARDLECEVACIVAH